MAATPRILPDIRTVPDVAASSDQAAQRGGLAGAVAAEQRHDLAVARLRPTPCRIWLLP